MCDAVSTHKLVSQFLQLRLKVYSRRGDRKGIKAWKTGSLLWDCHSYKCQRGYIHGYIISWITYEFRRKYNLGMKFLKYKVCNEKLFLGAINLPKYLYQMRASIHVWGL